MLKRADPTKGKGKAGIVYGSAIPFSVPTYKDPELFWKYGDWEIRPGTYSTSLAEISLCYGTPAKHRVIGRDTMFHGIWHSLADTAKGVATVHKAETDTIEAAYKTAHSSLPASLSVSSRAKLEKAERITGVVVEFMRRWSLGALAFGLAWAAVVWIIPALAGGRMAAGFGLLYSVLAYALFTYLQVRYCGNPERGFALAEFHLYTGVAKARAGLVGYFQGVWNNLLGMIQAAINLVTFKRKRKPQKGQ